MRMAEVVVETRSGKVRGQEERGVSIFKGIPYAAAPLGENRFRPPRKIEPWAGTRDALAYSNLAIQADNAFNLPADLMAIWPLVICRRLVFADQISAVSGGSVRALSRVST